MGQACFVTCDDVSQRRQVTQAEPTVLKVMDGPGGPVTASLPTCMRALIP